MGPSTARPRRVERSKSSFQEIAADPSCFPESTDVWPDGPATRSPAILTSPAPSSSLFQGFRDKGFDGQIRRSGWSEPSLGNGEFRGRASFNGPDTPVTWLGVYTGDRPFRGGAPDTQGSKPFTRAAVDTPDSGDLRWRQAGIAEMFTPVAVPVTHAERKNSGPLSIMGDDRSRRCDCAVEQGMLRGSGIAELGSEAPRWGRNQNPRQRIWEGRNRPIARLGNASIRADSPVGLPSAETYATESTRVGVFHPPPAYRPAPRRKRITLAGDSRHRRSSTPIFAQFSSRKCEIC